MSEFSTRLRTRSLTPGWEAMLHRDDGTAVSAWGATRAEAVEALRAVWMEEADDE